MSDSLIRTLTQHEMLIVDSVVRQLSINRASHYHDQSWKLLRNRVEGLLSSFLDAMAFKPGVFVTYIEGIARARDEEGFSLREVQTALRFFEEQVWKLVAVHVPREEQVECLARVTGVIGAAKDQLAQVYLQSHEKTRAVGGAGQDCYESCAMGTDSPPLTEEDRSPVRGVDRHAAFSRSFRKHVTHATHCKEGIHGTH